MAFSHKETNWSATLNQAKYQVTEIDNQATYPEYPIQNEVMFCPQFESPVGKEDSSKKCNLQQGNLLLTGASASRPHQGCEEEKAPTPVLSCIYQVKKSSRQLAQADWLHSGQLAQADWLHSCKAIFVGPTWGFQLSPDRFPFSCQAYVDWLAPGGLIIMLPRETRPTPNLGCLSWRQP